MPAIGFDHQRLVKENLLGLPERHAMPFPVFLKIPFIPIKAGAACEEVIRLHEASICQTYTPPQYPRSNGRAFGGEPSLLFGEPGEMRQDAPPSPSCLTKTQDDRSTSWNGRPWYFPPDTPRAVTTAVSS